MSAFVDALRSRGCGPHSHRVIDGLPDVAMGFFFLRWEWDATFHPTNSICEVSMQEGLRKDSLGEYNHAFLVLMKHTPTLPAEVTVLCGSYQIRAMSR